MMYFTETCGHRLVTCKIVTLLSSRSISMQNHSSVDSVELGIYHSSVDSVELGVSF